MAHNYLKPIADAFYEEFTYTGTDHYANVDENITLTSVGAHDGDTTYNAVALGVTDKHDSFTFDSWSPGTVTIASLTITWEDKRTGTGYQSKAFLRINGTVYYGDTKAPGTSYGPHSQTWTTNPDTGLPWTVSDINNLEAGVYVTGSPGGKDYFRYTRVYADIDYSSGSLLPSPTDLECDRLAVQTNATETPLLTAIFNDASKSNTVDRAYIEVAEDDAFTMLVWDSGWLTISTLNDGERCDEIEYDGSNLSSAPPDGVYYWRIKFKSNSTGAETAYSSAAQFSGINRPWASPDHPFRYKLTLEPDHGGVGTNDTLKFNIKTGNRKIIASNGVFNEAIQSGGHSHILYANGKIYLTWLSELDNTSGKYGIYVAESSDNGETWTLTLVDDAKTDFDTHNFPAIAHGNAGYLYLFYGCHNSACYFARSTNPDDSTSWETGMTIGTGVTYPKPVVIPSTGRLYMFARGTAQTLLSFWYTDNPDAETPTWNGAYNLIDATKHATYNYRVYTSGFRFDKNTERLHLAYSLVSSNATGGVWHIYSDFDDGEALGFKLWYAQDGTLVANVEFGSIGAHASASVATTDTNNQYYAMMIALLPGSPQVPVVLFTHQHINDVPQYPSVLKAAYYDSGWNVVDVTEQTGYEMLVARCGCPAMVDRDGTIHARIAVHGKRFYPRYPTSDGYYTNYSLSSGTDGYALIDDGWNNLDPTDYLYKTGVSAGTFKSNITLPANAQVAAVQVEVCCRVTDLNPATLYGRLRISGVDYDSSPVTVSYDSDGVLARYQFTWYKNPSTSSPWTKSEAEDSNMEFGWSQTAAAATLRIGRINCRPQIYTSTDDEYSSGEIVEVTSTDGGQTWQGVELTQNSGIGIPILSCKEQLSNQTMEWAWISGKDIFYERQNEPYGKVLRSGRDIRIYHQTASATTEVARIADYFDYLSSEIRFRAIEAIAAGRTAGAGDLYVYAGKGSAGSDSPTSDPNTVMPLGFDSFEELENQSNVNGQAGWTVNSGAAVIMAVPTEGSTAVTHTNKIGQGMKCVKSYGSSVDIEKTIGSGVTDIRIDCYAWMEDAADYIQLRAVDGTNSIFAVGYKHSSGYVGYQTDSGWTDHSTEKRGRATMMKLSIAITSSGCSAWVDDVLIADEVAAITSIDKIKLIGIGNSSDEYYFDGVEAYHRYFKRQLATISSGFDDAICNYHTSHTSAYDETNDAKHDLSEKNIYKIELKVKARLNIDALGAVADVHAWVSNKSEYDSSDIAANKTYGISCTYNTWVSHTFTFDESDMDVGDHSVKVDYYSVTGPDGDDIEVEIEEIKVYYEIHDPTVVVGEEEIRGWMSAYTIRGRGSEQWVSSYTIAGYRLERRSGLDSTVKARIEGARDLNTIAGYRLERRRELDSVAHIGLEAHSEAVTEAITHIQTARQAISGGEASISGSRQAESGLFAGLGFERQIESGASSRLSASKTWQSTSKTAVNFQREVESFLSIRLSGARDIDSQILTTIACARGILSDVQYRVSGARSLTTDSKSTLSLSRVVSTLTALLVSGSRNIDSVLAHGIAGSRTIESTLRTRLSGNRDVGSYAMVPLSIARKIDSTGHIGFHSSRELTSFDNARVSAARDLLSYTVGLVSFQQAADLISYCMTAIAGSREMTSEASAKITGSRQVDSPLAASIGVNAGLGSYSITPLVGLRSVEMLLSTAITLQREIDSTAHISVGGASSMSTDATAHISGARDLISYIVGEVTFHRVGELVSYCNSGVAGARDVISPTSTSVELVREFLSATDARLYLQRSLESDLIARLSAARQIDSNLVRGYRFSRDADSHAKTRLDITRDITSYDMTRLIGLLKEFDSTLAIGVSGQRDLDSVSAIRVQAMRDLTSYLRSLAFVQVVTGIRMKNAELLTIGLQNVALLGIDVKNAELLNAVLSDPELLNVIIKNSDFLGPEVH